MVRKSSRVMAVVAIEMVATQDEKEPPYVEEA